MKTQITQPEAGAPLVVAGALDIYAAEEVRDALLLCLQHRPELAVDLGAVTSCDPIGLQLLLAARTSAAVAGKPFSLTNVAPVITDVATALGLTERQLGLPT